MLRIPRLHQNRVRRQVSQMNYLYHHLLIRNLQLPQNQLLNQLTADATGRAVVTGPIEATAIGNVIAQMMALEYVGSLEEGRQIVRNSCEVATYEPAGGPEWDEAYDRFLSFMGEDE